VLRIRAARGYVYGAPVDLGAFTGPADLTAMAGLEGRPETRAANLGSQRSIALLSSKIMTV
jgi:hypothetical protein